MPLLPLVLILLHSSLEESTASVAPGREVVVMTIGAVEPLVLEGERAINERALTITTLEATLVPVLLLVRQVLRVGSYGSLAGLAGISEQSLVALDAERLLITEDVAVPGEVEGTVEA